MSTLATGQRLGPYKVVSSLGAGGMGEVYRARDTRLGRDVALKVLPAEVGDNPSRQQRFKLEARAVAALNHPNIVAVYDVGTEDGVFYIVSEVVDGHSLSGMKFGLRKTVDIAAQIANGMAAAHAAGITHRDLKPDNILLTADGCVKILDFGLAKIDSAHTEATETVTVDTRPGVAMGTVGYMSPEQVRGLPADHRSDIFSFGVILYELLSGKRAFSADTSVETMTAILKQEAPELPETVPAALRQIVAHCLEKNPSHRFQSARDLGFALSQSGTQSGMAPVVTRRSHWIKLKSGWIAAAALALVSLSVAADRLLWRPPDSPQWSGVMLGGPEMALGPRLSPDGHLLAFQAMVDGQTQVALMKPESGNWSVLTHHRDRGTVNKVAWSPDGAMIYYDRVIDVPRGVYSVPVLGGDEHAVLENADSPEVLPDGSMLVAKLNAQHQSQLFRFWPDAGRLQDLPLLVSLSYANARIMPGGGEVVVVGRPVANRDQPAGLYALDLASNALRRLTPPTRPNESIRAWTAADHKSVLTARSANRIMRISSIPINGRFRERTLFTTTSDVWRMDGGPDGSVYLSLVDRPTELVGLAVNGDHPEKIASFPAVADFEMIDMIIMRLPDDRAVVPLPGPGRTRLMAIEKGKDPVPLVNTVEGTSAPMTLAGPRQIACVIGPAPHRTIAVADIESGRIACRIAPGKGTIGSLTSSPDGKTLYFTADGVLWAIPSAGGDAVKIGAGDSAVMEPSGRSLVLQRKESSRLRMFRVPAAGGPEREIMLDGSVPLYSPMLSPGALDAKGRLLVSLQPIDSWFSPLGIVDTETGRITRVPRANLSDDPSAAWTPDGHIVTLQVGLRATILKFHQESR